MSARTALASWPITGRSSAESRPICFRTAVSSPFLPRSFTRSSSRAAGESAASSAASARCLMSSNSCFMIVILLFYMLPQGPLGKWEKKNPPAPTGDERSTFRGTTRYSPNGALCRDAVTPLTRNGGLPAYPTAPFQAAAPGRKPCAARGAAPTIPLSLLRAAQRRAARSQPVSYSPPF